MKTAFIIEEIVFAITWTQLYRKIFPKSKMSKCWFRRLHMVLIALISTVVGIVTGKQFLPLLNVCVSGCLNGIAYRHISSQNVVEAILTYLITKMLWGSSVIVGFALLASVGMQEYKLFCGISVCVIHIFLCFMVMHYMNLTFWKITTSKYYKWIVTAFGILFVISYSVLSNNGIESRKEFDTYTLIVITLFGVILLIWVKGTSEQQKIEEEQSKRIDELVRHAHKYKSVIPAVKRELRMMQRTLLREHRWETAAEVGCAIDEVSELEREVSADSARELLEAPNFSSTGLLFLDGQLQRAREDAAEQGIVLDCVVTAPVTALVQQGVLSQFQLQQMVGDLVSNAFRAVSLQEGEDKRVLLILGETQDGYQIKICDTGLPFPPEILREFGKRGLTTGGTGHGLADLREIMAACGGSIRVEEYEEGAFIKAISLVMDGRATLCIHSAPTGIDYERSLARTPAGEGV